MENFDKDIIGRYVAGTCSDDDLARLSVWVGESDDNARELDECRRIYLDLKAGSMSGQQVSDSFENIRHQLHGERVNKQRAARTTYVWRYAAIALMLIVAVVALWFLGGKDTTGVSMRYTYVTVPPNAVSKVILPDGSRVWLAPGARLRYLRDFADSVRSVDLRGRAYFEVVPDKRRQFTVKSNVLVVTTDGGEFNFDNDRRTHTASVSIAQGTAEVWARRQPGAATLLTGQKSLLDCPRRRFTVTPTDAALDGMWHNGQLRFSNAGIRKVASALGQAYGQRIVVGRDVPDTAAFTGTVQRSLPLDSVLRTVAGAMSVSFHRQGSTVHITAR